MTAWYRQGTAAVSNGSPNVVGTLTTWTNQVLPGDTISFDLGAKWYEVLSVADNTHLTLATNFGETTYSGAYAIQRNSPGWAVPAELAVRIGALISGGGLREAPYGTAAEPSFTFIDDLDTGFYRPAADTIGIATAGVLRGVITAAGILVMGHSVAVASDSGGATIRVQSHALATASAEGFFGAAWANDATAHGIVILGKSRGAAIGTHAAVQSGDLVGQINYRASDGTNFIALASVRAYVDGTPGTNDMPGKLSFWTTADGAASLTERMSIDSAGLVTIGGRLRLGGTFITNLSGNVLAAELGQGVLQAAGALITNPGAPGNQALFFSALFDTSSWEAVGGSGSMYGAALTFSMTTGALSWQVSSAAATNGSALTMADKFSISQAGSLTIAGNLLLPSAGYIDFGSNNLRMTHSSARLDVAAASNTAFAVSSSNNNTSASIQLSSKTLGAVTVDGRLLTDNGGLVEFGSFSNHDLTLRTNSVVRFRVGTDGTFQFTMGGTAVARFGATSNYNVFSLNNSIALNGSLGMFGAASGDASSLYLATPFIVGISVAGTERHRFSVTGLHARNDLATPAAAAAIAGVTIGSALIGFYWGTGTPNGVVTAPKGSIYIQTDGSGTANRMWINTNAGTVWTNFTTAA